MSREALHPKHMAGAIIRPVWRGQKMVRPRKAYHFFCTPCCQTSYGRTYTSLALCVVEPFGYLSWSTDPAACEEETKLWLAVVCSS